MIVDRRKNRCTCGSEILCREGDKIICLRCDKTWEAKRQDDAKMQSLEEVKQEWR